MRDEQIKYMVSRFLSWRLPENFNPDGGISFKRMRNEQTSFPAKNEPVGTNLLDATQTEEMIRYLIDGMPTLASPVAPAPLTEISEWFYQWWFEQIDASHFFNLMQKYLLVETYHKYSSSQPEREGSGAMEGADNKTQAPSPVATAQVTWNGKPRCDFVSNGRRCVSEIGHHKSGEEFGESEALYHLLEGDEKSEFSPLAPAATARERMHQRAMREKVCNLRGLVMASRDGFLNGQPYILTYSDIIEELEEIEKQLAPVATDKGES